MQDTQHLIEGNVENKGLKFNIYFHFPLPLHIDTDVIRLTQILINLTGNATKFTAEGHVNIDIEYNKMNNRLYFSVSDTGIGMTEEQLSLIFNSFSQADSSITKNYGGTGLGLSISKELSEKLGGDIQVSSEINRGSCFQLYIDPGEASNLELVEKLPKIKTTNTTNDNTISIQVAGHILIVEDTIDNQVLICTYLEDFGAQTSIANNGKECLDMLDSDSFDLILMDMQMPVMGGLEALTEIKNRQIATPVVMLTGNAFNEEKQRCSDAGCEGFLTKPINTDELQEYVFKYLPNISSEITNNIKPEKTTSNNISKDSWQEFSDTPIVSTMMGKSQKYDNLIFKFVDHLDNFIISLENAFSNQDNEKLASEAHRLKGVGGNYGFKILTDICLDLETNIQTNNRDVINRNIALLKSAEQRIINGVNNYRANQM